ncbi:lipopolysaccharide kinase InaA family protein [Halopseudomonas salegens]|uniref:Lipopolysaccharide kinase (Kdo/WaaP) family protein n=1 Tax=Halopseudomonas salegens TaxID=1434072 RepID=A0A1H2EG28_9GAMM|nr:lipopolysaccharide kinase InaA family protein [Halopseudomonas salegens]SDT94086.1 Lipopolysaccharide kinase (Kdo/WaaP) family protein [Halopseudomonas salegens]
MTGWTLNPEYTTGESGKAFSNLDTVFALQGEFITSDPLSEVHRVHIGGRTYYVKRYTGAGKHLRRYLGRPRVQAEWENLLHFQAWGIPAATVVGFGLERDNGAFSRGALITEELADTRDLAWLASQQDACLADRQWVARVSYQLAHATRMMHDQGFAHNDLKWRNVLVTRGGEMFLIDCPTGAFWPQPFLGYRVIKDLACLDKIAKYQLSRTQRLRFYLIYQRQTRLRTADKRIIRRILRFFEGRE